MIHCSPHIDFQIVFSVLPMFCCPLSICSSRQEEDRRRGPGGGERTVIEVTTDEAVGVALSLGRQVYVSEDIWEGARVSLRIG